MCLMGSLAALLCQKVFKGYNGGHAYGAIDCVPTQK